MTVPDQSAETVRDAVNKKLHWGFGAVPCQSACTHVIVGRWTALGIANVIARADERERLIDGSGVGTMENFHTSGSGDAGTLEP